SGQEPGENGSSDGFGAVVRATAGKLRVIRKMKSAVNRFEMWWPGRELNPRRQPFQGCALPPELPGHFCPFLCTALSPKRMAANRAVHRALSLGGMPRSKTADALGRSGTFKL